MRATLICALTALATGCISDDYAEDDSDATAEEAEAEARAWIDAHPEGVLLAVDRGELEAVSAACGSGPASTVGIAASQVALTASFWCDMPAGPETLRSLRVADTSPLDGFVAPGWHLYALPAGDELHAQERGLAVPDDTHVIVEIAARKTRFLAAPSSCSLAAATQGQCGALDLVVDVPFVASIQIDRADLGAFVPEFR